eukprot:TRINITY_DN76691_c0_g1_i1.p3 TRINITY_DN76691_c0_g1~~TRINITY_DN76691_c0_g1_i1.p3  ORF type:complete len:105 (-),score=5.74 TRINITY_DN76691_c0_g1_i1:53-367(-)
MSVSTFVVPQSEKLVDAISAFDFPAYNVSVSLAVHFSLLLLLPEETLLKPPPRYLLSPSERTALMGTATANMEAEHQASGGRDAGIPSERNQLITKLLLLLPLE